MNLNPGGKQPKMRPGTFNNIPQPMLFPNDHPDELLHGEPKGLKVVLEERGLWPQEGLRARCKGGCKNDTISCCAEKIMSLQEDFRTQKSILEETIKSAGHRCMFYPKFHPELNYIEYFWASTKHYTRNHCSYNFETLKKTVPVALASVSLKTIRKFRRRAQRYMSAYKIGLSYAAAEYAVKKYKSHRRLPAVIKNAIV
jgi:hypothetical protein